MIEVNDGTITKTSAFAECRWCCATALVGAYLHSLLLVTIINLQAAIVKVRRLSRMNRVARVRALLGAMVNSSSLEGRLCL